MTNPYTDTTQQKLIINQLTKQQYDNITPNADELYMVTDEYPVDDATSSTKGIVKPDNTTTTVNNGVISSYNTNVLNTVENIIPTDISSSDTKGFTLYSSQISALPEVYFMLQENAQYPRWQVGTNVSETNQYFTILFPDTYNIQYYTVENFADGYANELFGRIITAWSLYYTTDSGSTWNLCDTRSGISQVQWLMNHCNLSVPVNANGIKLVATGGGSGGYSSLGRIRFYGNKAQRTLQNSLINMDTATENRVRYTENLMNTINLYKADNNFDNISATAFAMMSRCSLFDYSSAENFSIGATGASYTATKNGILNICGAYPPLTTEDAFIQFSAYSTTIRGQNAAGLCDLVVPVVVGQSFTISYVGISQWYWTHFIPTYPQA